MFYSLFNYYEWEIWEKQADTQNIKTVFCWNTSFYKMWFPGNQKILNKIPH